MPKLDATVQAFIVERLACFDKPTEIADAVKEEFGIVIPRQQVEVYDPLKGCKTKKWVELHAATRKAFLDTRAGLAITHRAWRQRELEDMVRKAKKQKNYKLAAELLEQAAKEEGEAFTNHRAGNNQPVESEEQRVQRMRSAIMLMDDLSVPGAVPASAPTLTLARGSA